MHTREQTLNALLSLADTWDNVSLEKRVEADETTVKMLAANLYGYSDGLSLAAEELRSLIERLIDGDKHNGKA